MTSEPPHASSWAAPPEFYVDEGLVGKTLRRFFEDRGYTIHTPWKVFGSRHTAQGTADTAWLKRCGQERWAALGRDTKILERPEEVDELLRAKIHIFYYPGNATRSELLAVAAVTLVEVCTISSFSGGGAWRVRGGRSPRVEQINI